jgi:Cu2+-exporting ATPase
MRQIPGGGIEAMIDDRHLVVGSLAFVSDRAEVANEWLTLGERAATAGETPVLIALDGKACALARFSDPLRDDAKVSIERLRALGHSVAILSGDQHAVVSNVSTRLGVAPSRARGGASPEDKLSEVEQRVGTGPVVMVGDGVNDAAALARADVGIAVHGGAEASLAAADVFTTRPGVAPVLELFEGARRTLRVIRLNMALSLVYNGVCVALAMTGMIAPWIAAILMPLSSLTVVSISYRAHTFAR